MSNYEIMKRNGAERFLTYDLGKIVERLGLREDGAFLWLEFLSRDYRVELATGLCQRADGKGGFVEAGFNESMTIYDLLCHTGEPICLSGELLPMESLSTVQNASSYAGAGMFRQLEKELDGKEKELAAACEAMGGVRQGKGDVSYRIPVFGDVGVQVSFWCADEDFPASLRVYCDRELTKYLYYETLWYLVGFVMGEIQRSMEGEPL